MMYWIFILFDKIIDDCKEKQKKYQIYKKVFIYNNFDCTIYCTYVQMLIKL